MRLKSFKTNTFAGIREQEIEFKDGINILLGPNEAGKSTLVEAIFATLFKNAKLRLNRSADLDFKERFMPYPDGEYINGRVEFIIDEDLYRLEKEWSNDYRSELTRPDGQKLVGEKQVSKEMDALLDLGAAAYGNIVFARQREIKEAVAKITSDKEIINTVSSFLRRAVMELEGISIESLRSSLAEKIDRLTKRWDLNENRPENPNRDLNNPYQVGCGLIYEAYIASGQQKRKLEKARELEENYATTGSKLRELKKSREEIISEIKRLSELESDIYRRDKIRPELERLQEKVVDLKEVNQLWPVKENELARKESELKEINERLISLREERQLAKKKVKACQAADLLEKIDEITERINNEKANKTELKEITASQIEKLESFEKVINRNQAALEAATLLGNLSQAATEVTITRGVTEPEKIIAGDEFKAQGYLRVETDQLDLEIQSGEIDFPSLKEEMNVAQTKRKTLLEQLSVDDIATAKLVQKKYASLESEIKNLTAQKDQLLNGSDYSELKEQAAMKAGLKKVREQEQLEDIIDQFQDQKTDLTGEVKSLQDQLSSWSKKYESKDQIFDLIIDIRAELKNYQKELKNLQQLPSEFDSTKEFMHKLQDLRSTKDEMEEKYRITHKQLIEINAELPDESTEEIEKKYLQLEKELQRYQKKAKNLMRINEVVVEKLAEMDENSFAPLVNSFSNYLTKLTAGHYELGNVDASFELMIADQNKQLPVDSRYLSYGTYDSAALALRFALLDQLYQENKGFLVLDDCLVNLDPERRKKAVELIKQFANKHQVIFTTCSPATAEELAGKIINLV